jgi:hypothetical protein
VFSFSPEDPNYPTAVPSIYLQWKLLKRRAIEGAFLDISIGSRLRKESMEDRKVEEDSNEG